MTSTPPRNAAEAPETDNSEQDDEAAQAQTVADEALAGTSTTSPLDSTKDDNDSGLMDDSTQDLVDHMRDMEQSGRIDMGAYRGEPNHDDEDETYGAERAEDSD